MTLDSVLWDFLSPPVSHITPCPSPLQHCCLIYYFNYLLGCANNQNFSSLPENEPGCARAGEQGLLCSPAPCLGHWRRSRWCFLRGPAGAGPPGNLWGPLARTWVKRCWGTGRGAGGLEPDQGSEGAGEHPCFLPGPSGATGGKEPLLASSRGYGALCWPIAVPCDTASACAPTGMSSEKEWRGAPAGVSAVPLHKVLKSQDPSVLAGYAGGQAHT